MDNKPKIGIITDKTPDWLRQIAEHLFKEFKGRYGFKVEEMYSGGKSLGFLLSAEKRDTRIFDTTEYKQILLATGIYMGKHDVNIKTGGPL